MNIVRLIFWQPILSPHFFSIFNELLNLGFEITLIVENVYYENRINSGWHVPQLKNIKYFNLNDSKIQDHLNMDDKDRVLHIFSGLYSYPKLRKAMSLAKKTICTIL